MITLDKCDGSFNTLSNLNVFSFIQEKINQKH